MSQHHAMSWKGQAACRSSHEKVLLPSRRMVRRTSTAEGKGPGTPASSPTSGRCGGGLTVLICQALLPSQCSGSSGRQRSFSASVSVKGARTGMAAAECRWHFRQLHVACGRLVHLMNANCVVVCASCFLHGPTPSCGDGIMEGCNTRYCGRYGGTLQYGMGWQQPADPGLQRLDCLSQRPVRDIGGFPLFSLASCYETLSER
jgi:hypothetical protein